MVCSLHGISLLGAVALVEGLTPYEAQDGWMYHLEARRSGTWPQCAYRFLSYPNDCSKVDMWSGVGANQAFTLEAVGDGRFHLKTKCGTYLSYTSDCGSTKIDTWSAAGTNQEFRIADAGELGWSLEATGRASCDARFVGFPSTCSTSGPDSVLMQTQAKATGWNGHPASSPLSHAKATPSGCADPFAWLSTEGQYHIACTGGDLPLWTSDVLDSSASFTSTGHLLGGTKPSWAKNGNRWAPENVDLGNGVNLAVFCDAAPSDGKHRVGWAVSKKGAKSGKWETYSTSTLHLGNAAGGDIDPHVFVDDDGQSYLVWKTDDNSVGSKTTRIWAQPCDISESGLKLKGERKMIMDSAGLWWVDSWISGGSLVEGPEIVRRGKYYYLFFASGKYCQDSYSEGVARSTSVMGPFTKLGVPMLSTKMVGTGANGKLVGPGHASYLKDKAGVWHAVWHASEGENCNRHAYADSISWTQDGWPYIEFAKSLTTVSV